MVVRMKRWFLLVLVTSLCVVAGHAPAALTLVKRETFQGTGTLTSGNLDSFSSVAGTFTKVAVGPRVAGIAAPGWSADMRLSGVVNDQGNFTLNTAAKACGMIGAWVRVKSLPSSRLSFMQLCNDAGGTASPIVDISLRADGTLAASNDYTGSSDTFTSTGTATLVPNAWYFVYLAWSGVPGGNAAYYNLQAGVMPLGGSPVTWASGTNLLCYGTGFTVAGVGGKIGGGTGFIRLGCPSLYAMASLADAAYPADLIPPVEQPTNWYVNPAKGNDANDGLTPATAWATANKLSTESRWMGLLDNSTIIGPGGGDIVNIDTSAAPLALDTNTLKFFTQGITVQPVAGQTAIRLTAEKTLATSDWEATTTSGVYSTTNCEANVVIWQNDRWLNHVYAASASASATSQSGTAYPTALVALAAIPGSFYVDPTGTPTLYLHPFGNTDPRTDGSVYTRSQYRATDGTAGSAAVEMACAGYRLDGINVKKTSIVSATAHDAIEGYCIQHSASSTGKSNVISNAVLSYGSKHILGTTDGSYVTTFLIQNVSAEQGSPYTDYGGQSPFVNFNGVNNGHNAAVFRGCSTLADSGLIGSTAGTSGQPVYLCHGTTSGYTAYDALTFDTCNFPNSYVQTGNAPLATFVNSTIFQTQNYCPAVTFDRCTITGDGFLQSAAASPVPSLTMTNCVVRPVRNLSVTPWYGLQVFGTVFIEGCTFDVRGLALPGVYTGTIARYGGALSLTYRNNFYLAPSDANNWPLLFERGSNDTYTFDHNAYDMGGTLFTYSNDGVSPNLTFAQWQAAGYDANSFLAKHAERRRERRAAGRFAAHRCRGRPGAVG